MPLFVGTSSKAMPHIGIEYITDKDKAEITTTQNLDHARDPAEQFTATAKLNGHYAKGNERKYYHFKLSPAPGDRATVKDCHALAEQLTSELFKGHECVISTHTDTPLVHTHIIINAVNFETGKKMNVRNHAYGKMKDRANELGAEHGMSAIDFRKRAKRVLVAEAMQDMREVIDEALFMTTNMTDFKAHLREYSIVVRETKNTISYLHPKRKKPIRGDKIGEQYTKGAILDVFREQKDRQAPNAEGRIGAEGREKGTGVREYATEKKPSGEHTANSGRVHDVEQKVRSVNYRVQKLTPAGRKKQKQLARADKQKSVGTPEPKQPTPVQHRPKNRGHER